MKWFETLLLISNTSSSNSKQDILESYFVENQNNEIMQCVFYLQLDYKINSYLSDINKLENNLGVTLSGLINSNLDLNSESYFLNTIFYPLKKSYRFKKLEWIETLKALASRCSDLVELDFYLKSITKSLTIGLSLKGYNKVVSKLNLDLIQEFECMRCSSIADSKIDYSNCYVSVKSDGVNATYINRTFFSRNGGAVILDHIESELTSVFKDDYAIFGELVSTDRKSSSGIFNSILKLGINSKLPVTTLKLHIFDIIPINAFNNKEFKYFPFYKRLEILNSFKSGENFKILEHHKVSSIEEVYELNDKFYSQGEEGVIANDANGLIEMTRSKKRAKIKAEIDGDFKIVGYEQHKKQDNMLGSFKIESADGRVSANVGSGFSESDRIEFWKNKESLIGKICTVNYNSIDEKNSTLFLPVFKEIRLDKDEADII